MPMIGLATNICSNGTAVEGSYVTRRSHPATCPVSLAVSCPGGKPGIAQYLPVPAKGISVFWTINCQEPEIKVFYKDLK